MRCRQMHPGTRREHSVSRREDRAGTCRGREAGGSHGETEAAGPIRALRIHLKPPGSPSPDHLCLCRTVCLDGANPGELEAV